nr:MAG TPA: hypothetical protein [Caudoviricetes sp.]
MFELYVQFFKCSVIIFEHYCTFEHCSVLQNYNVQSFRILFESGKCSVILGFRTLFSSCFSAFCSLILRWVKSLKTLYLQGFQK